jgi:hypothetical protein
VVLRPLFAAAGVVDSGFISWLVPAARSAKTDACGRTSAVLSKQLSTVGLRLLHSRQAFGCMLEKSRDAVAVGENKSSVLQRSRGNIALCVQ